MKTFIIANCREIFLHTTVASTPIQQWQQHQQHQQTLQVNISLPVPIILHAEVVPERAPGNYNDTADNFPATL